MEIYWNDLNISTELPLQKLQITSKYLKLEAEEQEREGGGGGRKGGGGETEKSEPISKLPEDTAEAEAQAGSPVYFAGPVPERHQSCQLN